MDYDLSKIKEFITNNKLLVISIKAMIFIASFYFLSIIFYQNFQPIKDFIFENKATIFGFILISAFIYVGLLIILAKGWQIILESIDQKKIDTSIIIIYLKSLIYKYLPGNIFHYANRQIAANKLGLSHKTLLKSNVYEALSLVLSASIFAIFLTPRLFAHINYYILTAAPVALLLIIFSIRKTKLLTIIVKSIPYYVAYFFAIGSICYYVINYLTVNEIPFILCVSLYAIAWIAGFVIPGAPGGIGVRESIFIILSDNLISQPDAIIVISLLRLSTTLGEIIAYMLAQFNYRHQNDTLSS